MNLYRLLLAASVMTAGLPVSQASAYLSREVRDWSVSCTNGLTCEMSFSDFDVKEISHLRFRRTGAPDADIQLLLPVPSGYNRDSDPKALYVLAIDGKTMLTIQAASIKKDEDSYRSGLVYSRQAEVRGLLDAMKAGTAMELKYEGALGTFVLPVKLAGVKGSMLFIDEAQDRLQRTDAMEAKGDRAPPKETVFKEIKSLEDMPEMVRKDFTDSGGACSDLEPETIRNYEGFDIDLDGTRMIMVPCGTGGAYNQPYSLYFGYDIIIERTSFPQIRDGKPSTMSTAYNVDFDPRTRTLTAFFKGRGYGDCGLWSKWQFVENGGAPGLLLLEERRKDDCNEDNMGGPQNFPLTWPMQK